jgi:hypothetical protein
MVVEAPIDRTSMMHGGLGTPSPTMGVLPLLWLRGLDFE